MSEFLGEVLPFLDASNRPEVRDEALNVLARVIEEGDLSENDAGRCIGALSPLLCLGGAKLSQRAVALVTNLVADFPGAGEGRCDAIITAVLPHICSRALSNVLDSYLTLLTNLTAVSEKNISVFLSERHTTALSAAIEQFLAHNPQLEEEVAEVVASDASMVLKGSNSILAQAAREKGLSAAGAAAEASAAAEKDLADGQLGVDTWQRMGSVLGNLTRVAEGRNLFLDPSSKRIDQLVAQVCSSLEAYRREERRRSEGHLSFVSSLVSVPTHSPIPNPLHMTTKIDSIWLNMTQNIGALATSRTSFGRFVDFA
jgi:hypothetical protein